MDHEVVVRRYRLQGLSLAMALSFAFMAICLWWMLRELGLILAGNIVTAPLDIEAVLGSPLLWHLVSFAATLILCHVLLALSAFALARLTECAFPGAGIAHRGWLIAWWLALLVGLVVVANTTWHPSSIFAGGESWWRNEYLGQKPVMYVLAGVTLGVAVLAWRASPSPLPRNARRGMTVAAGALAVIAVAASLPSSMNWSAASSVTDRPHIVILGIDSLRADLTIPRRGNAAVPNIAAFLAASHRFPDAISPLARTYPAWMSVLTGRHPVTTNTRFNLMPRRLVREGKTLADSLRTAGYHAVYATDEARFANFDESFGFDEIIMPPVGVVDFVLGFGGDMPLVNLMASTAAGKWLFPSNHANRAAYVTYEPQQFVDRLESELEIEESSFIAIHLTLAHWPYAWSGMAIPNKPADYRVVYGAAIETVDRQFRAVLDMLDAKGVLDNAIVVLLSDHGEALGADNDSMLRRTGSGIEIWDSLWGHGTSVLSPNQYQVLLAMRPFGRAKLPGRAGDYNWPVSLEDIRPTLEALVRGHDASDVDGMSLLPFLGNPSLAVRLDQRVRFTETDFNTPSTLAGRYEASGVVDEAASYYEIDPRSGWVQLRRERLREIIQRKQRAAISRDTLLAYVPDLRGGGWSYLYTSRRNPLPRTLASRPTSRTDAELARLWDELQARFPGELPDLPGSP